MKKDNSLSVPSLSRVGAASRLVGSILLIQLWLAHLSCAQVKPNDPLPEGFQVVGRQPVGVATNRADQPSLGRGELSYTLYADKADRMVNYGDSLDKHVVGRAFVNLYTKSGSLVKALGLVAVWPFAATLSDNGFFVIAGNRPGDVSQPQLLLTLYNPNGVKQWAKPLPDQIPTKVFSSPDARYTAVVLYDPTRMSSQIHYYTATGAPLLTDTQHSSVSGIEFFPDGRVIVATGNAWFIHDLKKNNALLASGTLQGNTVGQHPISADPARNIFTIVTVAQPSAGGSGFRIQAFNSLSGAVVAESVFAGEPSWQPYRLAQISKEGTIQLTTSQEVITLRIK